MRILPCLLLCLFLCTPALAATSDIDSLREEARSLLLVQGVLSWYTRIVGEPSIQAETYRGHEHLLSPESMQKVAAAAQREADPQKKRALSYFKSYLATEYLGQKLAHFDDEVQNAELKATVSLPFQKDPVPYKQVELLIAGEKDPQKRTAIESARARVWKDTLNPILEKKEAEAQRLVKQLGYRSYVDLAQEYRMIDLRFLITEGERFRAATDALYGKLLAEVAQKQLSLKVSQLHRADINRLRKAPYFEKFFPKELMVPAFRHFLLGIGLDLSTYSATAAGGEVRIDDAIHPQKEPRAACFNIRVPGDVRISVKPTGGIDDFVTFFHEGGHALHFANTRTPVWEFQYLGPSALTEGYAETFGHVWDDPLWLSRYRDFVRTWNQQHGTTYPLMTQADITDLIHTRVFEELYFLRRYAAAKLIYESALHGGDPNLWKDVYKKPTTDLQAVYRELFGKAYGFPLSEEDALRYRTDVDDLFYSADYTKAFGLSNLIHEGLRQKYGADWYGKKEVGPFFRQQLFTDGSKLQADEVAQMLGYKRLDFLPTEARLGRLMGK